MRSELKSLFQDREGAVTPSLIIGAVVIVIIGVALLPVVTSMANSTELGLTGNLATLVDLIPLLYTVVLIVGVVAYVVVASESI